MLPVFDGHNDALTRDDHAGLATGRPDGHLDLPRMRAGCVRGAVFAVFTSSAGDDWTLVERSDGVTEVTLAAPVGRPRRPPTRQRPQDGCWRSSGPARCGSRARSPIWTRPTTARGHRPLSCTSRALRRSIPASRRSTPGTRPGCARSAWCGAVPTPSPTGCRSSSRRHPTPARGSPPAGHALVRRCAELGILVDLSHLNEAGFWDVARAEAGPLVASHSGVHALAPASRNLTDAQLDAIAASDGIVGIVFAVEFLREDFADEPDTPVELIACHAAYVAERIGARHVALGSDYDGATIPAPLGDVAGTPRLIAALRDAGFAGDELAAVAWGNWRRAFGAWWR